MMFAVCKHAGMEKKQTKLKTHLEATGIKQAALADMVGVSKGYMSLIINGKRGPRLKVALAIQRATLGAVPVEAWEDRDGVKQ